MILEILLSMALGASTQKQLEQSDRTCLALVDEGKVDAVRKACGTLEPADHPIAAYWRALLEDDAARRKSLMDPTTLSKLDPPGKRILLLAGRYHFAANDRKNLDAVTEILRRRYAKSPELDTLEVLRAGK